jgi:2-keto-3-deoxy-L-fuconate dehydrogenase
MQSEQRLGAKIALVTGAGRGIGRAIAERFAAEGALVAATQRDAGEGESLVAALGAERVAFFPADVRHPEAVRALVGQVLKRFGRIDILCNNAGVGLLRSVTDTSDEQYDLVMDTNVRGTFACCREVVPHMLAAGGGSVINIGSVAGLVGYADDAAYCASKGAVLALTRQMALDYSARGVRTNCICPGFVESEMLRTFLESHDDPAATESEIVRLHPIGRLGRAQEIAAVAAFLASDDASFVTGAAIPVDGGLLAM